MFCAMCGKAMPDNSKFCPSCGATVKKNNIVRSNQNTPVKPPEKPRYRNTKKPKIWISITSIAMSCIFLVTTVLLAISSYAQNEPAASDAKGEARVVTESDGVAQYDMDKIRKNITADAIFGNVAPDSAGATRARGEVAVIETAINNALGEVKTEYPEVTIDTVSRYLNAASSAAGELRGNNQIRDYERNNECVVFELNSGGSYVYAPGISEYNSGGTPELNIATYQPNISANQYKNIKNYESYPDDGARLIDEEFDAYTFSGPGAADSDYNDTEVNFDVFSNMPQYSVIIWDGHGCYSMDGGPLMSLGIKATAETDAAMYSLLVTGEIFWSSSGGYMVGPRFIRNRIPDGALDNTVIYIGTCSGGRTDELANAFLEKGAEAVYAADDTILTRYNAQMTRSICEALSTRNSAGKYYSVEEALVYAKDQNGEDDGSKNSTRVVLFTENPSFTLDWYQDHLIAERDVVLVLDVSGSMSGEPLNETKEAAVEFVDTVLDENARIGIVAYDTNATVVSGFSTRRENLVASIGGLYDRGRTNIDEALQMADQMLSESRANKKIIVLMSDGIANEDRTGQALIDYANTIKNKDIYIYTLGFFSSLSSSEKLEGQQALDGIATEGHHYEVENAEDLKFFFSDMADTISGQKYIYVEIACPVNVKVTKDGETLDSSEGGLNTRTSFGTLTFEESENAEQSEDGSEDRTKILRLKDGMEYDIEIEGTDSGTMDYTVQYMDENGDYSDKRSFEDVPITRKTQIATVAAATREETVLNVDEDGDGRYDMTYKAKRNEEGKEFKSPFGLLLNLAGAMLLWLVISIFVLVLQIKKLKYLKSLPRTVKTA